MKVETREAPKLDRPGAGLPVLQQVVARVYLGPWVSRRSNWDEDQVRIDALHAKILGFVEKLSDAELKQKVLVPPQRGLEDSSRYWSAAMTVEHLVIAGTQMRQAIALLSKGVIPPVVVNIAKVKPLGEIEPSEAIRRFRAFAASTPGFFHREVKDRQSGAKLKHPWFGGFTARQWHWLMAQHAGIHYQQLKEIKKGFRAEV